MSSTTLPEVGDYLLRFIDIEGEIIVVALFHQILYICGVHFCPLLNIQVTPGGAARGGANRYKGLVGHKGV